MAHQINLFNPNCPSDILIETFLRLDPKKHIEITTVSKTWKIFATEAFKMHFIIQARHDLNQKLAYLLSVTGKKVSDYCPALEELFMSRQQLTLKEIYHRSINLTEKHEVFLNRWDVIYMGPNCFDSPSKIWMEFLQRFNFTEEAIQQINTNIEVANQRKNDICGKAFLSFTCKEHFMEPIFCDGEVSACIVSKTKEWDWQCGGVSHLPIELFNLKVQGKNNEVIQIDEAKDCCLFVRGKLIEFIIIDEEWSWTRPTLTDINDPFSWSSTPTTAKVPTLEGMLHCHLRGQFYIPQLDSKTS